MLLHQGVMHLAKGAHHLGWKIHPLPQGATWPSADTPNYCAVARLRGCENFSKIFMRLGTI
jgi:hypothetical protein